MNWKCLINSVKYIRCLNKAIVFVLAFATTCSVFSQDRVEIGGFAGTSYYLGDLNPGTQFRNPHVAVGGIGRYVFTDRVAVKGTAILGRISGQYPQKNVLLNASSDSPYAFSRRVLDVAAMVEYNFLSYDHQYITSTVFTPYITFGLGTTAYNRYSSNSDVAKSVFVLSLPFGAGVKYKLTDWVRVGAEWTFRKMFVDDLDYIGGNPSVNAADPYGFGHTSKVHNNDWVSYAGVYVTFNMFRRKSTCNSGF